MASQPRNIHTGAYTQKSQSLTYKTKTHPKIWIINKLAFPKKPLALIKKGCSKLGQDKSSLIRLFKE